MLRIQKDPWRNSKVIVMSLGDHEFEPWQQPFAELQSKAAYNRPFWSGPLLCYGFSKVKSRDVHDLLFFVGFKLYTLKIRRITIAFSM